MARRLNNQQQFIRTSGLFIMLALLLKVISMPYEPIHWDTNYYLNIGMNYINHGELTPYMWRLDPNTNIIAGSGTGYGILLLVLWLKIFGVSVYSGYILMYIVGVMWLFGLYFLVRMWWQSWVAGVAAVVFTALSTLFMVQFYVRMDAIAALAYILVLWLHIWAVRTNRRWVHFGVGIAIICAAEVHIQALLYVCALSLYYLLQYIHEARQQRKLFILSPSLYYFAGAFLAGIVYLMVHVLPDPEAYFIIARYCDHCEPAGIPKELLRFVMFFRSQTILVFVFIIALGFISTNRSQADNHYLVLLLGYLLAQAVISPPTDVHYMSHLLPLISLVVGGAFVKYCEAKNSVSAQHIVLCTMIAGLMTFAQLINIAFNMASTVVTPDGIDYVREHVPPDTVVMGHPRLYHALLEYDNFLTFKDGDRYTVMLADEDFPSFWERVQPQVYVGELDEDDSDWLTYMRTHDFKQVRDTVWISGELFANLTTGHAVPEITFTSQQTQLALGECTRLDWDVTDVDIVALNGRSIQAMSSEEVCPISTTVYTIAAVWIGGIEKAVILIEVD
jgi:hypothetical protein